jgi:hypothetical protein
MKREHVVATGAALGVISLLAGAWFHCHNQPPVYSLAIYSAGHSWRSVCSFKLPVILSHFSITQESWIEDTNGYTMGIFDKMDGERRACSFYEIQLGSHSFHTSTNREEVRPESNYVTPVIVTTKLVP